jgi:hypothetical protein
MMANQRSKATPSPTAVRLETSHIRGLACALVHPEAGIVLRGYASDLDVRANALEAAEQRAASGRGLNTARHGLNRGL